MLGNGDVAASKIRESLATLPNASARVSISTIFKT